MHDIVDKISSILLQQTCQVYWTEDAVRDAHALKEALGLSLGEAAPSSQALLVNKLHLMGICDEDTFVRIAHSLRPGKTKAGHVRVDAVALRRAILRRYDNDVVQWLQSEIQKRKCIKVPTWFASAALPLPHDGRKGIRRMIDFNGYGKLWMKFKDIEPLISRDVIACSVKKIASHEGIIWDEIIEKIVDEAVEQSSLETIEAHCVDMMRDDDGEREDMVVDALVDKLRYMDSACKVGVTSRARHVRDLIFPFDEWIQVHVDACCEYISTGVPKDFCKTMGQQRKTIRQAPLEERARDMDVDLDELRAELYDVLWMDDDRGDEQEDVHLEDMLDYIEDFREYEMTIEDWYYEHEDGIMLPKIVTDDSTGRTTEHVFLCDAAGVWRDAAELAAIFTRLDDLITELDEHGLELRKDSRVCETFVVDGTYVGPTEFVDASRTAIAKVVDLMVEMKFLFANTPYSSYVVAAPDSETAKRGAVYAFLTEGDVQHELPRRLKAMHDAKGEKIMRESCELCEKRRESYDNSRRYDSDESDW